MTPLQIKNLKAFLNDPTGKVAYAHFWQALNWTSKHGIGKHQNHTYWYNRYHYLFSMYNRGVVPHDMYVPLSDDDMSYLKSCLVSDRFFNFKKNQEFVDG